MSLNAYQKVARASEDPRATEYRLFADVTKALLEAQSADANAFALRSRALDWNKRVWAALSADCAEEGNALPEAVRAQIISIGIFVQKHTREVIQNPDEIDVLIDINRTIMQGLAAQRPQSVQAPRPSSPADADVAG